MRRMKHNKTSRFLVVSLILLSILTICTFSFLGIYMGRRSTETIGEVGRFYMDGMSERIALHFSTTIDLRLNQVAALVQTHSAGAADQAAVREDLVASAQARGFDYLALCTTTGELRTLFGAGTAISDPQPFLDSLNREETKVAVGMNEDGEKMLLMGVSATYPMEDGDVCTGLVAGLPVDYLSEALSLNTVESLLSSYIIRRDGSFVIRSGEAFRENYFERLDNELAPGEAAAHIAQMQDAMRQDRDYAAVLNMADGGRRHLHSPSCPTRSGSWWWCCPTT